MLDKKSLEELVVIFVKACAESMFCLGTMPEVTEHLPDILLLVERRMGNSSSRRLPHVV